MFRHLRSLTALAMALAVGGLLGSSALPMAVGAQPVVQATGPYIFSAKFVCGKQGADDPELSVVRPGHYATEVNIHNYHPTEVTLRKRVIPLVVEGQAIGREPEYGKVQGKDGIVLPPDTATMDDCYRLTRLLGLAPGTYVIGFLEIVSPLDLSVDAVYTVEGRAGANTDIEVQRVDGKLLHQ